MSTFQFKIQIKYIDNPPVWRRLLIAGDTTFHEFHEIIQVAFEWENSHMYQFSPKGWGSKPVITLSEYEKQDELDSPEVKLSEIFTKRGQTYMYIYDFGDDWKHDIKLEKIIPEPVLYPTCTGGEGAGPIEDSGGAPGYANLLAVTSDPDNPDYDELRGWVGLEDDEDLDAGYFNMDELNEDLREWKLAEES
ncbi:plasmid pRiA4b ORF-3 family protein [Mucilaginibacter dorajii]|uniref:Plasmid pRiA4b ORF-3 family protein n=1 Tax=Mucilaginibacter dorajii TaxID=692994 RepID=A0ABP7Q3X4_9SPHI|nr:plasmid pRiA4b ORF-3 family protein [Mucilaginibacter dorajii]MCS3732672.1 hypothetical protein [Mucilaginibacter dorajii]